MPAPPARIPVPLPPNLNRCLVISLHAIVPDRTARSDLRFFSSWLGKRPVSRARPQRTATSLPKSVLTVVADIATEVSWVRRESQRGRRERLPHMG